MKHSFVTEAIFIDKIPFLKKIISSVFLLYQKFFYGKIVKKTINGITYELDLSETIDSSLYFLGYYEKYTSRILAKYIQPEMSIIEIGANIGAHTFEIAKRLNHPRGMLYSFEPTSYAFQKLSRNYDMNNFENIILENLALADTNEEKNIHRASSPETMPFKANWDKKKDSQKGNSIDNIKFRKLDNYVLEHNLEKVDMIKIDVDGYELRVLKGARQTIKRFKPVIIIELGSTCKRLGDSPEDLISFLMELEYSFHSMESEIKLEKQDLAELLKRKNTIDCLCLPIQ